MNAKPIEADGVRHVGDLINATQDEVPCSPLVMGGTDVGKIPAIDDDEVLGRLPKALIGRGLSTNVDMCANSGEIAVPTIMSGSGWNLKFNEKI